MIRSILFFVFASFVLAHAAGERLEGKVALITGAAKGIGKETAFVLAREGAHVIVADIDDVEGRSVVKETGGSALYLHLDVRNESDWQMAMQAILNQFSKLDILVNNAGILGLMDPENGSLQTWRDVQAVNVEGVFLGCKYAIRTMKTTSEHGSIINLSSISRGAGIPGNAAYAASKAAVVNLTKSVAVYCGQQGYKIRCNSIVPGFIPTPMLSEIKRNEEQEARFQAYITSTPMGKMGTADDVAYAVVFLASAESKYITGTELTIDGGVTAWTGIPWVRKE